MTVALYMDVHIPRAITVQLRLSGVDVLTAQEDGHAEVDDMYYWTAPPNWGAFFLRRIRVSSNQQRINGYAGPIRWRRLDCRQRIRRRPFADCVRPAKRGSLPIR